jgi:hypothetical protein
VSAGSDGCDGLPIEPIVPIYTISSRDCFRQALLVGPAVSWSQVVCGHVDSWQEPDNRYDSLSFWGGKGYDLLHEGLGQGVLG